MEQTSSTAYPNIMVVDYVRKARVANQAMLQKAEAYLSASYQRMLTFEHKQGGFGWYCGSSTQEVWLSAYALQCFSDMSKVYPIDRGVIDRTQQWLMAQRDKDGAWSKMGNTHNRTVSRVGNTKFVLTSYITWALLESGVPKDKLAKAVEYIRQNQDDKRNSTYALSLAANALAAYDADDDSTRQAVMALHKRAKQLPKIRAICYPAQGESLNFARGDSAAIETTALVNIAMSKTRMYPASRTRAYSYLIKMKNGSGTWGSTAATVLTLKSLVAGMGGAVPKKGVPFAVLVDGKQIAFNRITNENYDVMQMFDLASVTKPGGQKVTINVDHDTDFTYQILCRHYEPWQGAAANGPLQLNVAYDRVKLKQNDNVKAKATLRYNGKRPTSMVMVELGIPPGFEIDKGDFENMVTKETVDRFETTPGRVVLYLGSTKPGDVKTFNYILKAKHQARVQTPISVAYEYYTPANRAVARPVTLTVGARE